MPVFCPYLCHISGEEVHGPTWPPSITDEKLRAPPAFKLPIHVLYRFSSLSPTIPKRPNFSTEGKCSLVLPRYTTLLSSIFSFSLPLTDPVQTHSRGWNVSQLTYSKSRFTFLTGLAGHHKTTSPVFLAMSRTPTSFSSYSDRVSSCTWTYFPVVRLNLLTCCFTNTKSLWQENWLKAS